MHGFGTNVIQAFAALLPHSSVTLYNVGITIFCSLKNLDFVVSFFSGFQSECGSPWVQTSNITWDLIGKQQISQRQSLLVALAVLDSCWDDDPSWLMCLTFVGKNKDQESNKHEWQGNRLRVMQPTDWRGKQHFTRSPAWTCSSYYFRCVFFFLFGFRCWM